MVDTSASHGVSSFLTRRHSLGDGSTTSNVVLPPYPSTTPDHVCREFNTPEGIYTLFHSIFVNSMQPLYPVGTSASLISIKYKEVVPNNLQRYEPQPGARSFRRMFSSGHTPSTSTTDSDDDHVFQTPSLSSSSSSNKNIVPITEEPHNASLSDLPTLTSTAASPTPTSTLSFLSRNHTLGRHSRKPKTNITKTNSSFVQKIITNDQLAKILMARTSEDTNLFYNCGTSFVWADASGHPKEPLSRIVFARACPTSHDVNVLTRGADHLDVIIGFTSGDIIWFDPLCNKYGRINKGGIINSSPITMIKWLQGYENLFMASFQDGTVIIFDKDKEDEPFHPGDGHKSSSIRSTTTYIDKHMFKVSKHSLKLSNKCNPISHWKLSDQSITAFAFSPDCQHVAIVGLDGLLRVVNFLHESVLDIYEAYYGGLYCVAWSPDGRYILTGGQDDLVTIWAFREQKIIARCQGHKSWITGVAFDPWRCDEKVYRFASVGEDAKLIFWDFSVNALHKPKTKTNNRNRGASVSSVNSPPPPNILGTIQDRKPNIHPVQSKTQVAFLQPTMVQTIHGDPCVGIYFREDVLVTTDKRGRVSIWQRPPKATKS
ncbi:WD40-repeat-containing domain protein [Pilobolus umbonatus]|nr:WD40-repeat-containing domain protein [Pilobolus umbonatus]